jgi:hypothetical protein
VVLRRVGVRWVVLGWVVLGWVVLGWVVLGWVVLRWVVARAEAVVTGRRRGTGRGRTGTTSTAGSTVPALRCLPAAGSRGKPSQSHGQSEPQESLTRDASVAEARFGRG